MALQYTDLDEGTRRLMLEELELDIKEGRLYLSPRLSSKGAAEYPALLRSAIERGNDASLAQELRSGGRLNAPEQRKRPKGGHTTAAVPVTAQDTLAEGEFNRFYARALCRRAQNEGDRELKVHRAKPVENPRSSRRGERLSSPKSCCSTCGRISVWSPRLGYRPVLTRACLSGSSKS